MKAAVTQATPMTAIWVFARRSLYKTLQHPFYFLIDIAVFPVIFLFIFTFLFGGAIAGSTGDYLQFLLPGMFVYTVTTMTVYTGTAIHSDIDKGVFNRFRTLPFWQPAAVVGMMAVDVLRYTVAVTVMLCIGMALGFRPEGGIVGAVSALLAVVLFAFSASWIFASVGVLAKKSESLTTIAYLILYPLMFTSNVFVDSSTMPRWVQAAVDLNPLSLAASAVRGLIHGNSGGAELLAFFVGCGVLLVLFVPLTIWLYRRKGSGSSRA